MTKTLSYPREVAESLLAECLHSPEVVLAALSDLRPEVFRDAEHEALWRAIVAVFKDSGGAVDPVLVGDHLARTGQLEAVGGVDSLAALAERVPYAAHFEEHARILTDYHNRRELHVALMERAKVALDPTVSYDDAREYAYLPDSLTNGGARLRLVDRRMTAAALVANYPTNRPALIEGLLRRGEVGTLVNSSKSGKSWLLHQLALCVASGRDWLGMRVQAGRALVLDLELHHETLAFRMRSLAQAMELPEAVLSQVDCIAGRGTGVTVRDLAQAAPQLGGYSLVVLDPLYRSFPDRTDENSNSDLTRIFDELDKAAEASGAAWLVSHHASKGGQAGKSIADVGAGAGAIARAADLHLVLRQHAVPGVSSLEAVVRSFPPVAPFCVVFDWPQWQVASEDLDPSDLAGLKPTQGQKVKIAAQDAADDAEAVFSVLQADSGYMTKTRILAAVQLAGRHMHEKRVRAAVERLLHEGRIVEDAIKAGGNGKRVPGYATPDKPKQTEVRVFPSVSGCSAAEQEQQQDEQTESTPLRGASVRLSVGSCGESQSKRSTKRTGKQRAARKKRPKKRLRETSPDAPETTPDVQDGQSPEQEADSVPSVAGERRATIVLDAADIVVREVSRGGA